MRVAIADDAYLIRRGLRLLLETLEIEVAFEAADAAALLTLVEAARVDAVIIDIKMPYTDEGLVAAETLAVRYPGLGILLLSQYAETGYAMRLLEARDHGVGYLHKDRVDDQAALLNALERVCAGGRVIDPDLVDDLIRQIRTNKYGLTPREIDVIRNMAEGLSNKGIGRVLGVSSRTVEASVSEIFRKLALPAGADDHRRVHAVLTWLRGIDS